MSSDLEALRAAAGARKRRGGPCAFCGEAVEVAAGVSIRERGPKGAYLATRPVSACARCAIAAMDRFFNPNGGQHE